MVDWWSYIYYVHVNMSIGTARKEELWWLRKWKVWSCDSPSPRTVMSTRLTYQGLPVFMSVTIKWTLISRLKLKLGSPLKQPVILWDAAVLWGPWYMSDAEDSRQGHQTQTCEWLRNLNEISLKISRHKEETTLANIWFGAESVSSTE